jgi:hypothetical protein
MCKRLMAAAIFAVLILSNIAFFGSKNVGAQGNTVIKLSTHPDNIDRHDYIPQIAVDDTGNSYVVWRGHDGHDFEIYWVKVDSTGTPGTVQMISTHPDNVNPFDWYPQIDVDSAGNSYVVWEGMDIDNEIYWVKIDSAGTPGTVQKISTHPDNINNGDYRPQIKVDDIGNSYVVWYGGSSSRGGDIYWVKVDNTGTPGIVQKISNNISNWHYCKDPQIAIDNAGNSYVAWWGGKYDEYDIYWAKVDDTGTPGTAHKISTHPDNLLDMDLYPQIAVDNSGNSYVVWHGSHGYDLNVYWVKVDNTGTPGTALKASTNPRSCDPHIAVDSFGNSYVVWHVIDWFNPVNNDIFWVRIDNTGTPGTIQMVSNHPDNTTNDDYAAQIAIDNAGNSHIVWHCWDGNDNEIYWTYVDSTGTPGTAQKISTHLDNINEDEYFPHIGLDTTGNSYVVFRGIDRNPSGYDYDVYFTKIETPIQRDSDGDGIPDELDECPFENPQGLDADTNGCIDNLNDFPGVIQDINLRPGIENSLISKTENALKSFQKGNVQAAINQLEAFINQVEALKGKKISEEDADLLIQYALNIIQQLQQ